MSEEAIAVLRVADAAVAQAWYGRLGFEHEWTHRYEPHFPAFVSVARGGVRLFLSEHTGDARADTLVFLRLERLEEIAREFDAAMQEGPAVIELTDPDGNRLRIGRPLG